MINKSIGEITLDDIKNLSKSKIEENVSIEYKSELNIDDDKGKKEFVKDILSMANSEGGYIIIGIDEKNNFALKGMHLKSWDNLQLQMISTIKDCSDPIFTDIGLNHFQLENKNYAIVIRVGKSAIKPHRSKKDNCFYKRIGTQCVNLDMANLKQEFLYTYLMGDINQKKDNKFVQEILDEKIGNGNVILTLSGFPSSALYQNITQNKLGVFNCYNNISQKFLPDATDVKIVQNGVLLFDNVTGFEYLIKKNGEASFCYDWSYGKENLIDCRLFVAFEAMVKTIFYTWQTFFGYTGECSLFANILKAKGKTVNYPYYTLIVDSFEKDRITANVKCYSVKDEEHIQGLLDELCNAIGLNSYNELKNIISQN